MRIINKKYLLIILLVGVILIGVIVLKPNKEVQLDNVILKQEANNKTFAMYIQNDDKYEEYKDNKFPEGYDLNLNKSKCIDNSGQEIEKALYVQQGKIGVKSNKSFYCYLYFDLLEEKEFDYTGNYQVFIAPKTGEYQIELWGASGGSTETGAEGGKGAYTKGTITLNKQDKLYIYIGESGEFADNIPKEYYYKPTYNGGGSGLQNVWGFATSGGGATDVRLDISETGNWDDFNSLKSRIMIAGGGGGGYCFGGLHLFGGSGGTLNGGNGKQGYGDLLSSGEDTRIKADPTGGTQTSGGIPNDKKTEESFGKFGKGGNNSLSSSGGGGGYYGGAGGSDQGNTPSSGAGGSSFISGYVGCVAINKDSTEENIITLEANVHYSGKIFTDTVMFAGNESMPTHDGKGTMVGNTGNGHAKIKLINVG